MSDSLEKVNEISDLQAQIRHLEQRLDEKSAELTQSKKIQSALFKIADAAGASQDMKEFYKQLHQVISELMYAENFFIAFHDKSTGTLSFPYFIDLSGDSPPPPQPLDQFGGSTRENFRTMQPVRITRADLDKEIEEGKYDLVSS